MITFPGRVDMCLEQHKIQSEAVLMAPIAVPNMLSLAFTQNMMETLCSVAYSASSEKPQVL